MFLDSNGDGLHTSADQVNPAGPTTVDVWLDTANNRDGSPVVCGPLPSQVVDFFGYQFALRANGGTITWGSLTNRQTTMNIHFGPHSSASEFVDGYGGQTFLPPGRYLTGTLVVTVASGTPAIDIVRTVSISPFDYTSFGSRCYGQDFDNTLKLGSDWFDADGLPFGTGGSTNLTPVLQQPNGMTVATGELAFQPVTATDADHQPLTFSKASGPSFMTVTTTDVGTGTASGSIALAPLIADVGAFSGTVSVTDGFASDSKSFAIQVMAGPNHAPSLSAPDAIRTLAGSTPRTTLRANDPDGQALSFRKSEGPDFVEVTTLASGPGAASGSLRLTPGICDVGEANATIQVTDGIATSTRAVAIEVLAPQAAPSQPSPTLASIAMVLAVGDLNRDGQADVASAGLGFFEPFLGQGNGTFVRSASMNLGRGNEGTSIALGDWNQDGLPDVAVVVVGGGGSNLLVMLGNGAGGFGPGTTYPLVGVAGFMRTGDLNNDGSLDLVVTHGAGAGVFLGRADGTFMSRSDVPMGNVPRGLVLSDFDNDGRLDLATANISSDDVVVRDGLGDGTFGDLRSVFSMNAAFQLESGDWNKDGTADLAVISEPGATRILLGDGLGGFAQGATFGSYGDLPYLGTGDLNQDGEADLVISTNPTVAFAPSLQVTYGKGDGTFGSDRVITNQYYGGVDVADLNYDGFPDIATASGNLFAWLNDAGGAGMPEARAFSESKGGGKPAMCVRLEPVGGSYRNIEVDPTSLRLSPEDDGGSVHAITTKSAVLEDTDGNGIAEIPACFARDEVAALFDTKNGRQTVTARVHGALLDGRQFCTGVTIDIIGTGKKQLAASLTPNPLNPGGVLRLTTSSAGFVRVRIFDLQGRVVRVLEDRAMVPAGAHDVRIDGRNTSGQTLASGVYFYQVETSEGTLKGRITVLK